MIQAVIAKLSNYLLNSLYYNVYRFFEPLVLYAASYDEVSCTLKIGVARRCKVEGCVLHVNYHEREGRFYRLPLSGSRADGSARTIRRGLTASAEILFLSL